jgi:hypothetical protein
MCYPRCAREEFALGAIGEPKREIHIPVTEPATLPVPEPDPTPPPAVPVPAGA